MGAAVQEKVDTKLLRRERNQERLLESLLNDFQEQSTEIQDQVILDLSSAAQRNAGSFFCTTLNCPITIPCQAEECHYHSSTGKASHNCILKAKFDAGSDGLSIDVISDLTDIPESRIRASLEKTYNKVRAHTLLSDINAGNHNRFTYYSGAPVCVVCGAITPKKPFVVDKTIGLSYCSRACYKKKPPSLIKLEVFYKCDIRAVLIVARKVLKKLPLISNTLDVKRRILVKWYDEFLGIHPSVFGADAVEFVDIMRRTTPKHSWCLDFLSSSFNKYGPSVNSKLLDLEVDCKKLCKSL